MNLARRSRENGMYLSDRSARREHLVLGRQGFAECFIRDLWLTHHERDFSSLQQDASVYQLSVKAQLNASTLRESRLMRESRPKRDKKW
jgi:hypothetical protein